MSSAIRQAGPLASAALSLVLAGCGGQTAPPADPPVPVAARPGDPAGPSARGDAAAAGAQSGVIKTGPFEKSFDQIRFSVPAGWKEVEPSPQQRTFIDARFQIPTPRGEVSLTCSSNAGGIESNVQRWVGQFQGEREPVIEELDVGGRRATWVDLEGMFSAGPMSGGPGPGAGSPIERMLGVAIPLGERDFYLKLTGSKAAIAAARDEFRRFAREARVTR
jgi:hypothetical protein